MSRRLFNRFLRWLGLLMGVYFLIAAVFSLTVDPWRINNTRWAIAALDPAREISSTVRVGKAALANRGCWQTVILGSSRIEIGLDPDHPVFAGGRAVNLAMSAANLCETIPAGHYAIARNPELKTVILGVDPGDLHNDIDSRKFTRFYQSPFADNNRSIERGINQVIGGHSLVESIATLKRHANGVRPQRSQLGQWLQPNHPPNLREYVESTFRMGFEPQAGQWASPPPVLRQTKAAALAGFIKELRHRGIALVVIVPPLHGLKQIHPTEDRPAVMGWEADLAALAAICRQGNAEGGPGPAVQLWSFLTFNDVTTAPLPAPGAASQQLPGWFDLGHAQTAMGNRMLATIFGRDPAPVGVNLLVGDWSAHRAAWIEGHQRFCAARVADVAWWRGLVARYSQVAKVARPAAESAP